MSSHASTRRPRLYVLFLALIALAGMSVASAAPSATHSSAAPTSTTHIARGPAQAPSDLPVFRFIRPQISATDTFSLTQKFDGVYNRQEVQQDTYKGRLRFTMPNTVTNALLEQYSATGGFYAYNAQEAFSETQRGPLDPSQAQILACQFLLQNDLFPKNVLTPGASNCNFTPTPTSPYSVTQVYATSQDARTGIAQSEPILIGLLVQVPMELNTGQFSQYLSVPLGGPGGHLSLLFRTTQSDQGFSLDTVAPGLAAAALPFYGRQFQFLRKVPAVDRAQAQQQIEQQVRAAYPGATDVTVPDPELIYPVSDAGTEQIALEPKLNFEGVQVTVGDATFVLKDLSVPAVQSGPGGFGPLVSITAPASGSTFVPGSDVTLTGSISDGTAPYTYTWELDDGTVLKAGTLAAAGTVSHTTNQLPVISHNGFPAATTVHLRVQDSDGAEREALVSLRPTVAPSNYLPVIVRSAQQAATAARPQPAGPITIAASNYSFGIEAGSDYPPYGPGGPDLGGVPPDANGFRSALLGYGWTQIFYWSNAFAWERDWRDCSLGGGDCTYGVDRADFVYYSGHGSNGGISLPSSVDSSWFPGTNARFQRARWVGFSSCLTLRAQWTPASEAPIRNWFNAFQGAHMLLGFNSLMADVAFGGPLIDNMRVPSFLGFEFPSLQRTIREAWVLTAFELNAGKPAYIYAVGTNGVNPVNNKLPRAGDPLLPRPFPVASYHWVWWNE